MKKALVGVTVAASTIGGMAGAIAFTPGISGAQDGTVPDTTVPAESTVPTDSAPAEVDAERPDRTEALRSQLDALVDDGTITADQADAVASHLATTGVGGQRGMRGHGGKGGFGNRGGFGGGGEIAETLGLTRQEVVEALRDGQTVAELAEANGVDIQVVIDQIVANAQERVDGAVEAGRIDADKAAEIMADAESNAEAAVNGERPAGGFGRGGRG